MPVLIAVRPTDEYLNTREVVTRLETMFKEEDVVVFVLPTDIESVNYGRGVGYEIIEWVPPDDVAKVSGTQIRSGLVES